jgi:anti-anti-sigma regulatory factor
MLETFFPDEARPRLDALVREPPPAAPEPRTFTIPRGTGEPVHVELLVAAGDGESTRLVLLEDVTARRRAEEELARKMALIEEQNAQIFRLSTPILHVWKGVLSLPVIGPLDAARAARMMDALLGEVARAGAGYVVVDLTGVPRIDAGTVDGIVALVQAVRLLGALCVLSGIQAEVARAVVGQGLDLRGIVAFPSLHAALRFILRNQR